MMMMYVCEGIVNLAIVESISMDLSFAFDVLSGFFSHFNDVLTFSFMDMNIEEFEEKYEEFEDKIWRNTSIHSVIPLFTMNGSINK